MTPLRASVVAMASLGLLQSAAFTIAHAQQDYPVRSVRIITAAAGGGSDFVARIIAPGLTAALGQPVIVENRGTGVLAGEAAARAPADGHTLAVQGGAFWIHSLLRKTPYDVDRDFAPVSLLVREVNVLAISNAVPATTVKELIAYARTVPGKLNFSSPGVGSTTHLAGEMLQSMTGTKMVHVPYQGNQPAITALISGEVQLAIFDAGLIMPHARAGKLRALAATSLEPSALTPGLTTVSAAGVPGFESIGMTGLFVVGAKTSPSIISRVNQEVVRFINRPEVREQFLKAGVEIVGSTPEQFTEAMRADIARTSRVIREIGLKVE
jgi:tripartite-type tricarboxylate transporter receptor subunit TctC